MSGRIWPGALCVVVNRASMNHCRLCVAVDYAFDDEDGPEWWVQPIQPMHVGLRAFGQALGGSRLSMDRCTFPASWLKPITPPPGTELADTDVPAELVGV